MPRIDGVITSIDKREKNFGMMIENKKYWKLLPMTYANGEEINVGHHVVLDYDDKQLDKGIIREVRGDLEKVEMQKKNTKPTSPEKPKSGIVKAIKAQYTNRIHELTKEELEGYEDQYLDYAFALYEKINKKCVDETPTYYIFDKMCTPFQDFLENLLYIEKKQ